MSASKQQVLSVALPIVIIAALGYIGYRHYRLNTAPRDKPQYAYTAYAIDDEGKMYSFGVPGRGLEWPVIYEGKELKPLYGCADCKHKFAGNIGAMTIECPACGSRNVGGYNEEYHGPITATEIEVKIEKP